MHSVKEIKEDQLARNIKRMFDKKEKEVEREVSITAIFSEW